MPSSACPRAVPRPGITPTQNGPSLDDGVLVHLDAHGQAGRPSESHGRVGAGRLGRGDGEHELVVADVDFPLPLRVEPGDYEFMLTVTATETCGTDPAATLTGTASLPVRVKVDKNPVIIK